VIVRGGLTFLEVLLSAAMLTMIAGAITAAHQGVHRMSSQQEQWLEATEVAHRLILNYLLDPQSLPEQGQKITRDLGVYEHVLKEEMLVEQESEEDRRTVREPVPEDELERDERLGAGLKRITIEIYPLGQRGRGRPLASLSRTYNPFEGDEDVLLRQVQELMGQQFQLPVNNGDEGGQ